MARKKKKVEKKSPRKQQKNAVQRYINETIAELRKVSWPTRKEATNLTIIVIVVTLVMSLLLGFLDFVFAQAFGLLFTT